MEETMENIIQVEEWNAQDAIALKRLLSKFIKSYGEKSPDIDDQAWLKARFMEELSSISEEAAERLASETVAAVQEYDENLSSIHRAAAKGTNTEKWLANQIAKASSGISVVQYGEYLKQINTALQSGWVYCGAAPCQLLQRKRSPLQEQVFCTGEGPRSWRNLW